MNIIRAKKERNSFRDFTFRARFSHGQQGPKVDYSNITIFVNHQNFRQTSVRKVAKVPAVQYLVVGKLEDFHGGSVPSV
jgi:hypothetical protein